MTSRGRRRAAQRRRTWVSMRRCRCGKVRSGSRAEAEHKYVSAGIRGGHLDRVRFYVCEFGGWHWTRSIRRQPGGPTDDAAGGTPSTAPTTVAEDVVPPWRQGLTPEQVAWLVELSDDE